MRLTDLDRVIEAMEREEKALYEIADDLLLSEEESTAASIFMAQGEIRRQVTLLRTMRNNAVEGCVLINDDSGEACAWLAAEVVDAPKAFLVVTPEDE